MKHLASIAFVLASLPVVGLAESASEPEVEEIAYSFDDELVTGDFLRPDTEVLAVRRRGARPMLIEVRMSFVTELLESAEDL